MFLLAAAAFAYETDQLTDRADPLVESRPAANARMNEILDVAIAEANRRTRCEASDERTLDVLIERVYVETSRRRYIGWRGLLRGFGFGEYSAWMESGPVDTRSFQRRDDLFGQIGVPDSLILAAVGPCSTLNVNGVLVGTDKFDHFFAEGYRYWRKSRQGEDPDRAIRYGTLTERAWYGLMTSKAFSYADLLANWEGYQFYAALLDGDPVARAGDGCVARTGSFDWAEYVDDGYDELVNPPVFTRRVQARVSERLADDRARYCVGFAEWGPDVVDGLDATLGALPDYAGRRSPERTDPWGLQALCGG